jgi:hypothetical protein
MTTRSATEAAIIALRDNAMVMLEQGAWHGDGNGHRLRIRETEDLRVAYAGPFQMGAEEMPENLQYFAAANAGPSIIAATGAPPGTPRRSPWRRGRQCL